MPTVRFPGQDVQTCRLAQHSPSNPVYISAGEAEPRLESSRGISNLYEKRSGAFFRPSWIRSPSSNLTSSTPAASNAVRVASNAARVCEGFLNCYETNDCTFRMINVRVGMDQLFRAASARLGYSDRVLIWLSDSLQRPIHDEKNHKARRLKPHAM